MTASAETMVEARNGYGAAQALGEEVLPSRGMPPWLLEWKRAALDRFGALGLPTKSEEAWRFTRLGPLEEIPFLLREAESGKRLEGAATSVRTLIQDRVPVLEQEVRLVFVDGMYRPELSRVPEDERGLVACSLPEAFRAHGEALRARLEEKAADGFRALNAALFQDGAYVVASSAFGMKADPPVVHLVYVATPEGRPTAYHPRHVLVAETGARLQVVETYLGTPGPGYLVNGVTQVVLEDGARLDHVVFQAQEVQGGMHLQQVNAVVGGGAHFSSHVLGLGSEVARLDLAVRLEEEGAGADLRGVLSGNGGQHLDLHTWITHRGERTESFQDYRSVLDGRATSVFDGTIHVTHTAQKSRARQSNRNLLLSGEAVARAQPRLEIDADDVQCAHGATVGQLDPEALFYLRSRGIGLADARDLLVRGFLEEVLGTLPFPSVHDAVEQRLAATRLEKKGEST